MTSTHHARRAGPFVIALAASGVLVALAACSTFTAEADPADADAATDASPPSDDAAVDATAAREGGGDASADGGADGPLEAHILIDQSTSVKGCEGWSVNGIGELAPEPQVMSTDNRCRLCVTVDAPHAWQVVMPAYATARTPRRESSGQRGQGRRSRVPTSGSTSRVPTPPRSLRPTCPAVRAAPASSSSCRASRRWGGRKSPQPSDRPASPQPARVSPSATSS